MPVIKFLLYTSALKKAFSGCKEFSRKTFSIYLKINPADIAELGWHWVLSSYWDGSLFPSPSDFQDCSPENKHTSCWSQPECPCATREWDSSTLLNMDHSTVQWGQDKGWPSSEPTNTSRPEHPLQKRTLSWSQMHKKSFQALSLLLYCPLGYSSIQIHSFMPNYL